MNCAIHYHLMQAKCSIMGSYVYYKLAADNATEY
jgi:hypothetical protein